MTDVASVDEAIEIEVVRGRAGFESLEDEWNGLFNCCARGSLMFQTFNWNWHWLNHFSTSKDWSELIVLVARRAGLLQALWPLVRVRRLGLVVLEWTGAPVSQYGDVLIHPAADSGHIMQLLWSTIQREAGADIMRLSNVREDALIVPLLKARGGRSLKRSQALFVDLSSVTNLEQYERRYSAKARRNRRTRTRRLMALGDVRVEVFDGGPVAAVAAREAIDLKVRQLDSKETGRHALQDPRFTAFFADVAESRTHPCDCRVTVVRLDGLVIGATIVINAFGHRGLHIIGFDAQHKSAAPGIFLVGKEIEAALQQGIGTFDFLAPKYPYKEEFADGSVDVNDYCVPLTALGSLLCAYWVGGRTVMGGIRRLVGVLGSRARNVAKGD
jgi:CelD/BcsL family acetyltransferase involved in cellulose biosynthesis